MNCSHRKARDLVPACLIKFIDKDFRRVRGPAQVSSLMDDVSMADSNSS